MTADDFKKFGLKALNAGKKPVKGKSYKGQEELKKIGLLLRQEGYFVAFEYAFHADRKWRFDMALPNYKIAVEYEGIFSKQSRHTSKCGYSADTDKYNEAALDGWCVLRKTAMNMSGLLSDIRRAIKSQSKSHKSE